VATSPYLDMIEQVFAFRIEEGKELALSIDVHKLEHARDKLVQITGEVNTDRTHDGLLEALDSGNRESIQEIFSRAKPTIDDLLDQDPGYLVPPAAAKSVRFVVGPLDADADVFMQRRAFVDNSPGDAERRMTTLKKYLLYAHEVIVPDPLVSILQYFHRDSTQEQAAASRRALSAYFAMLSQLRPLVQSDIVGFYPEWEVMPMREQRLLSALPASAETEPSDYPGLLLHVAMTIRYRGLLSLPDPESESSLLKIAFAPSHSRPEHATTGGADDRAKVTLQRLASANLPDLSSLPLSDIVTIRRDSEAFDSWRTTLAAAVAELHNGDDDGVRRAEAVLQEGTTRLRASRTTHELESVARSRGVSFALGIVRSLFSSSPLTKAPLAALQGVGAILYEYAKRRPQRSAHDASEAHYAVWGRQ